MTLVKDKSTMEAWVSAIMSDETRGSSVVFKIPFQRGDFAPVIDRIKSLGKRIIVMSVKGHISKELLDRAKYVNLKKLRNSIELKE